MRLLIIFYTNLLNCTTLNVGEMAPKRLSREGRLMEINHTFVDLPWSVLPLSCLHSLVFLPASSAQCFHPDPFVILALSSRHCHPGVVTPALSFRRHHPGIILLASLSRHCCPDLLILPALPSWHHPPGVVLPTLSYQHHPPGIVAPVLSLALSCVFPPRDGDQRTGGQIE